MASGSEEARVPISLPVDTNAGEAAQSVEALRDKIAASKNAIRDALGAMSDLKGKTDAVKAAKDQLTAKVEQERAAVTAASLKLIDQGTSYGKLAAQAKLAASASEQDALAKKKETDAIKAQEKATADSIKKKDEEAKKKHGELAKKNADQMKSSTDAMSRAIDGAGGPVASLKGKLDALDSTLGGSGDAMAALAGGTALAVAAIAALAVGIGALAYKVGEFVVKGNDMNRVLSLTRQANYGGNAEWAKKLGEDIDDISRRVPVTKERLNDLSNSLLKARISGKAMTDALEAISGASAAAGDDLGNKLDAVIKRGSLTKRFQLSPMELMGGDLDFNDVAKALAKGMNVSVDKAKQALFEGRVKLADGAKALKDAVQSKFGEIDAEKLRTLDGLSTKLANDFKGLTKDVDLSPLWKGLEKLEKNFDLSSVNGQALKHVIETIGRNIGLTFEGGVPLVQDFIDKAVYGALRLENMWLRAEVAMKKFTNGTRTLGSVLGEAFGKGGSNFAKPRELLVFETMAPLAERTGLAIKGFKDDLMSLRKDISDTDWVAIGRSVPDGLVKGLGDGATALVAKMKDLAKSAKDTFKNELGIHSPSKVFEDYGENVSKGAARGIDRGAGETDAAVQAMIKVPNGAGGGGRSLQLTFAPQFIVQGGGGSAADQIKQSGIMEQLWNEFRAQMRAAGFEVPS